MAMTPYGILLSPALLFLSGQTLFSAVYRWDTSSVLTVLCTFTLPAPTVLFPTFTFLLTRFLAIEEIEQNEDR
jgi:hypothetical protein